MCVDCGVQQEATDRHLAPEHIDLPLEIGVAQGCDLGSEVDEGPFQRGQGLVAIPPERPEAWSVVPLGGLEPQREGQ